MTTQVSIDKPVHRIAIVGTGVIGASWSAFYLAFCRSVTPRACSFSLAGAPPACCEHRSAGPQT